MSDIERGKYIVFEGGEATGKTTQSQLLAERIGATWTREPGGDDFGAAFRVFLLDPSAVERSEPKTDMFLFAAQRAELAATTIRPALDAGVPVVSDRSWISSAAYQTAGENAVDLATLEQVNQIAMGGLFRPDLVLLFDVSPLVAHERLSGPKDYYESRGMEYHEQVRRRFLEVGREVGASIIDASLSIEEVTEAVNEEVYNKLGL